MGNYETWEKANRAREELRLSDAIIKKAPYTNLIGIFSSCTEKEAMYRSLKMLGYFPYTIETEKGIYRLLVGGHISLEEADEQRIGLNEVGIHTRVVKR